MGISTIQDAQFELGQNLVYDHLMSMYTQEEFNALKRAYASGVLTVRHGEKLTTYRSLTEMKKLLGSMKKEIENADREFLGVKRHVPAFKD